MGDVWKAWDPRLQRPVALKVPRIENLSEGEALRFLREGRAAAQLRHPNIAAVYEVDRDGKTPYIASEFVDGENLRDYCERSMLAVTTAASESMNRRLTFYAIADLCAEIAEALHHAHEQGVVHRDLKPANIIIDRANRPRVIDFGLAKWATDDTKLTLHGELLGTPAYMSPEQAAGETAKIDRRTDVYALGAILFELLSGQCPFTGEVGSVIHKIIAVQAPSVRKLNVKVPRDLETICTKALEKDPGRRYATMQEMAVDLRRFARGESILSRRAGPIERSRRWIRLHPGVAAAILAIVFIVGTSSVVIRHLIRANYDLQGNVKTEIKTEPAGASITIVPIDHRTGEPSLDSSSILRPEETTPLRVPLRPGDYLIEAVLPSAGDIPDFAEVTVTVPSSDVLGQTREVNSRVDNDNGKRVTLDPIVILPNNSVTADMIAVPIDAELRHKSPSLPELIYVDAKETSFADEGAGRRPISNTSGNGIRDGLAKAIERAAKLGKRLPSAAEYDAIVKAANENTLRYAASGRPATIADLAGGLAEWTTTKYDFPGSGSARQISAGCKC